MIISTFSHFVLVIIIAFLLKSSVLARDDVRIRASAAKKTSNGGGAGCLERVCEFEAQSDKLHVCKTGLHSNQKLEVKCSAEAGATGGSSPGVRVNVGVELVNGEGRVITHTGVPGIQLINSIDENGNCLAQLTYLPHTLDVDVGSDSLGEGAPDGMAVICYIQSGNAGDAKNPFFSLAVELRNASNAFPDSFFESAFEFENADKQLQGKLNKDHRGNEFLSIGSDLKTGSLEFYTGGYGGVSCDFLDPSSPEYKNKFCTRVLHPSQTLIINCPDVPTVPADSTGAIITTSADTSTCDQTGAACEDRVGADEEHEIQIFPIDKENVYIMEMLANGKKRLKEVPLKKISAGLTRAENTIKYGDFDKNAKINSEIYLVCHNAKRVDQELPSQLSMLDGVVRVLLGFTFYSPAAPAVLTHLGAQEESPPVAEKINYISLPTDRPEILFKCPNSKGAEYVLLPKEENMVFYAPPLLHMNPFNNDKYNPQGHIGHAIAMAGFKIEKTSDSVKITRSKEAKVAFGLNPQVFFVCLVSKRLKAPPVVSLPEFDLPDFGFPVLDLPASELPGSEPEPVGDADFLDWDSAFETTIIEYSPMPNLINIRICGAGYNSFDHNGTYIEDIDCTYPFASPQPQALDEAHLVASDAPPAPASPAADGSEFPAVHICPLDEFNPEGPKCIATVQGMFSFTTRRLSDFFYPDNMALSLWILDKKRWEGLDLKGIKHVTCHCHGPSGEVISKLLVPTTASACIISISLGLLVSFILILF